MLDAALDVSDVGCGNLNGRRQLALRHVRELALLTHAFSQRFIVHIFTSAKILC